MNSQSGAHQPQTSSGETTPDALICANTAQHYKGKSARELAAQVRILHPDAVVVMPDLSVHSYQKYATQKMDPKYHRKFANLALNPPELSAKGIEAVIASGFYQNRAASVASKNGIEFDRNDITHGAVVD